MPRLNALLKVLIPLALLAAIGVAGYSLGWWQQAAVRIVYWQGEFYHALVEVRVGSGVRDQRIEQAVDWAEELQERSGRLDVLSHELLGLARASAGDFSGAVESVDAALESPRATDPELRRRLAAQRQSYLRRIQPVLPGPPEGPGPDG